MPEAQVENSRPDITVVTAETMGAYVNERLGIPAEDSPEAIAAKELADLEAKQAEEEAAKKAEEEPAHDLGDQVPEEKKGKLNKRFSELTQARKEAEAKAAKEAEEARVAKEDAARAKKEAEALRAKYEPPKPAEIGPEPQPAQFNDLAEYAKALKDWASDNAIREKEAKEAQVKAQKEQEARISAWNERQKATRAEIPDYDSIISASTVQVSDQIRDAIIESEVGPKVLVHLATHPEEAEALASLSVGRALVRFGKLEASLSGGKPETGKATVPIAQVSKAPAPISPIKAGSGVDGVKVDSEGNFYGSYEEYKRARLSGKLK